MDTQKSMHTLVLDTGAIIKNEPSVSSLLAQSDSLITVPAVISEIRDAATRSRLESTLLPFLTLRTPNPASVKIVSDFARRTGDLAVLSKPDVEVIALAYEIECERNGGDWRLRRVPGQKRLNGAPPSKPKGGDNDQGGLQSIKTEAVPDSDHSTSGKDRIESPQVQHSNTVSNSAKNDDASAVSDVGHEVSDTLAQASIEDTQEPAAPDSSLKIDSAQNSPGNQEDPVSDSDSDSDSEGWITPSNLKKKQAKDAGSSTLKAEQQGTMQVAVLTTDFAMQNVIMQMNLNLLSPSLGRVKHLKTFVLRCHACFQVTKDMSKQFCPRCGGPSLTRVSCSTNANGEFKLHLRKNMQWNNRGDRYSIPKPVHGSSNGKVKGGGKGGWGNELILAEDQKEYQRAAKQEKKQKERSLMDEDYLPGILTGDRRRAGGRVKAGAGRNVNSRKR